MTATGQPGLPWRVLTAWGGLRGSIRSLIENGVTESRLLAIAMLSGLVQFLQTAMLARFGATGRKVASVDSSAFLAAEFIGALFFRTIALYGVAAVFGLILRRLGGRGGWIETRAAVFWAFLVVAPVQLVLTPLSLIAGGENSAIALVIGAQLGALLLAVALSIFLAETHRMKARWIFLGIVSVSLAGIFLTGLAPGTI